ncbi:hypothetical protein [Frederiksenia canicola]|uniref:Uncharacterized protein n=1 Tax=Frederiksenia canicola TaxID=123824 RepID=A0AAE6X824_9PAST|nr:hypothetical protein [Frederiksenia canicola]QIM65164.1 hypothetical protein A4G17_06810 [Frederiksenia canicola]
MYVEKNSHTTQFLNQLSVEPTASFLNIGNDPSTLTFPLSRQSQQVYALDFAKEYWSYYNNTKKQSSCISTKPDSKIIVQSNTDNAVVR